MRCVTDLVVYCIISLFIAKRGSKQSGCLNDQIFDHILNIRIDETCYVFHPIEPFRIVLEHLSKKKLICSIAEVAQVNDSELIEMIIPSSKTE
jgi:hypothetical protein